jgi:ubiquinone/menaquinone biosynthesis C-methylase UbiE
MREFLEKKCLSKKKWMRYFYLADNILKLNSKSVLDVGSGFTFLPDFLKKNGIEVKTLDIDEKNKPDTVGSILKIPFGDNSFDTTIATHVLEHLPIKDVPMALNELKRVSKNILLSRSLIIRGHFYIF